MLKIIMSAAALVVLPVAAFAGACPSAIPHCGGSPAPAPLLAAGIPAFLALGGGTAIARLMRRRRERKAADHGAVRDAAGTV
jgi:hypothetical protein